MNKRRKILFIMSQFNIGGVEKSLLQLLSEIDHERYEVSLLLTGGNGVWESKLIGLCPIRYLSVNVREYFFNLVRQLRFAECLKSMYAYLRLRLARDSIAGDYWAANIYPMTDDYYDCVICFDSQDITAISTAAKTNATIRIMWHHGSLQGMPVSFVRCARKLVDKFTHIVSVSRTLSEEIIGHFPSVQHKTHIIYNLIDKENILRLANEPCSFDLHKVNIVTVGRLFDEKGQDLIPQTLRRLLDEGYNVCWYVVGDGPLRKNIEAAIKELKLGEHLILTGAQANPYPFINNCSIYVQPSRSEGWGLTVQEAKLLKKPIVTTPLDVMREQINHGVNGVVADDITSEAIGEAIKRLADNPALCHKLVSELDSEEYDSNIELQKLYAIFDQSAIDTVRF